MYSRMLRRGGSSSIEVVRQDVRELIAPRTATTLLLWEIEFTDTFLIKLCRLRQPKVLMPVVGALGRLADGNASTWRQAIPCHATLPLQYLEFAHPHVPQRSHCVVFSIGINVDRQLQKLTVWTITKKSNLQKKVRGLERLLRQFSDGYLANCRLDQGEAFSPRKVEFPDDREMLRGNMDVESQQVECVALLKTYEASRPILHFLATHRDVEDALLARRMPKELEVTKRCNLEVKLPYKLDDHEMEIVNCPRSALALGRSGTGKTSVLCRKILETDLSRRQFSLLHGELAAGHQVGVASQLFVTSNFYLREKVEQEVRKWQQSALAIGQVSPRRDEQQSTHCSCYVLAKQNSLQERAERAEFPCFLTFDDVLFGIDRLLCVDGNNFFDHDHAFVIDVAASRGRQKDKRKRVTLEVFESEYWPHMSVQVRRLTNAATLFEQMQHHMKGGLEAMTRGYSSGRDLIQFVEHHYVEKRGRKHTVDVSTSDRVAFLDALKKYEAIKRSRGEWDYPDACHAVFHAICSANHEMQQQLQVEFLYVDEIQDLIPAQVVLLSRLCRNAESGLMLFGDAAQCVAPESDFCFAELKDLIFKWWLHRDPWVEYAMDSKKHKCNKSLASFMPTMFHLVRNYRCRSEVLQLANFVMELLRVVFPESLDHVEKEQSLLVNDAFKPVFMGETSVEAFRAQVKPEELTSEDVLLVQNHSVKQELCKAEQFMECNVLTIAEAKGLEFTRVIIYNFFKDSGMASNWRVLYSVMPYCGHAPPFSRERHRWLLRELRALYVAITRAKEVVLFYDQDAVARQSFLEIADMRGLVRRETGDDSHQQRWPSPMSTNNRGEAHQRAGWFNRGESFFRQGLLKEARQCFEQASDGTGRILFIQTLETKKKVQKALRSSRGNQEDLHKQLIDCAHAFVSLMDNDIPWDPNATALAIECLELAEAYEELAKFYYDKYYPRKDWLAKAVKATLYGRKYDELKNLQRKVCVERPTCLAEMNRMLLQFTIETYCQLRRSTGREEKRAHSMRTLQETVENLIPLCTNEQELLEKLYLPYREDRELFEILRRHEKRINLLVRMAMTYEVDSRFNERAAECFRKANHRTKAIKYALLASREFVDHRNRWHSCDGSTSRLQQTKDTLDKLLDELAAQESDSYERKIEMIIMARALKCQLGKYSAKKEELLHLPVALVDGVGSRLGLWLLQLHFDTLEQEFASQVSTTRERWQEMVSIVGSIDVILSRWMNELKRVKQKCLQQQFDSCELIEVLNYFLAVIDERRKVIRLDGEHRARISGKYEMSSSGNLPVDRFIDYAIDTLSLEFEAVLKAVSALIQARLRVLSDVVVMSEQQQKKVQLLSRVSLDVVKEMPFRVSPTRGIDDFICLICKTFVLARNTMNVGIPCDDLYANYREVDCWCRKLMEFDHAFSREVDQCSFVGWNEVIKHFMDQPRVLHSMYEAPDLTCTSNDSSIHVKASTVEEMVRFGQDHLQKICRYHVDQLHRRILTQCKRLEKLCRLLRCEGGNSALSTQVQANDTLQQLLQLLEQLHRDSVLEVQQLEICRCFLVVAFLTDPFECSLGSEATDASLSQLMASLMDGMSFRNNNASLRSAVLADKISTSCAQHVVALSRNRCIYELTWLLQMVSPILARFMGFSLGAKLKCLVFVERLVVFLLPLLFKKGKRVPLVLLHDVLDRHQKPFSRWERCAYDVQQYQQSGMQNEKRKIVDGLLDVLQKLQSFVVPRLLQEPQGVTLCIRLMGIYAILAMNPRSWCYSVRLEKAARDGVHGFFRCMPSVDPLTQLRLHQEWMHLLRKDGRFRWMLVRSHCYSGPKCQQVSELDFTKLDRQRKQNAVLWENSCKVDQLWQDVSQHVEKTCGAHLCSRIEQFKTVFHLLSSNCQSDVITSQVLETQECRQLVNTLAEFCEFSLDFSLVAELRQVAVCFMAILDQIRVFEVDHTEENPVEHVTPTRMRKVIDLCLGQLSSASQEAIKQESWSSARNAVHDRLGRTLESFEADFQHHLLSNEEASTPQQLLDSTAHIASLGQNCAHHSLTELECAIATCFGRILLLQRVLSECSLVNCLPEPTFSIIQQSVECYASSLVAVDHLEPWQVVFQDLHKAALGPDDALGWKQLSFLATHAGSTTSLVKRLRLMEYVVGHFIVTVHDISKAKATNNARANLATIYCQWHKTAKEWTVVRCDRKQMEEVCASFLDDSLFFALVAKGNEQDPLLLLRSVLLLLLMEHCVPDQSLSHMKLLKTLREVFVKMQLPANSVDGWVQIVRCKRKESLKKIKSSQHPNDPLDRSNCAQMLCELVQVFS